MQLNPILVREVRARWRGATAFKILFGYAALFAAAVGWLYASYVLNSPGMTNGAIGAKRFASVGHDLFTALSAMQVGAWTLLAPALTATAIAGEREEGMLDLLHLAPLSPARIVLGKLLSTLWFCGLLMLAPLPVIALSFLMGGVSPAEFGAVLLLQVGTATSGAALGLCCSAWCRRSGAAIGLAFGLMLAFLMASALAFVFALSPFKWWSGMFVVAGLCNPIIAVFAVTDQNFAGSMSGALPFFWTWPAWIVCVLAQGVLCVGLLWSAARGVRKPLPETEPVADTKPTSAAPPTWIEVPFLARLRFSNPMLQREAQRRLRWRRPARKITRAIIFGVLALAVFYRWMLFLATQSTQGRAIMFLIGASLGLLALITASSALGATSFAREKETRTWQSLQLSFLTPREIISGKLWPVLLQGWALAALFWLALLPTVDSLVRQGPFSQHVAFTQWLALGAIYALSVWCYTCWGMWVSWRCGRVWVAIAATIASLVFVLVFVPIFLFLINPSASDGLIRFLFRFWHPFFTLIVVFTSYMMRDYRMSDIAFHLSLVLIPTGGVFLILLHNAMKKEGSVSRRGAKT